MGLGTKIKEALSGDKDKDNYNTRRRKTPGAYPESSVDIPRTNTWQSTNTNTNRPMHETKPEGIAEERDYDEYTHVPADLKQGRQEPVSPLSDDNEDEPIPVVEQRNASVRHDKLTKQPKQQYPYWGEFGKPNTNDFTALEHGQKRPSDKDVGIDATRKGSNEQPSNFRTTDGYTNQAGIDANHFTYGNDLARNDTVSSNTHPALRGTANGGARGEHINQFDIPTNDVNRGRGVLVDDEAAKATSMVASQVSQPSQPTHASIPYESVDQGYNGGSYALDNYGTAHGDGYGEYENSPTVQRTGTINGRGPANTTQGLPEQGFGQREQPSPVLNSPNGGGSPAKSVGGDHYGPGHAGARVLHRCQHCGNDNDITKYFKQDVVYRLS